MSFIYSFFLEDYFIIGRYFGFWSLEAIIIFFFIYFYYLEANYFTIL